MAKNSLKFLIGLVAAIFIIGGIGFAYDWVFLPAQEELRYEVTQNSTSYVRGKIQSLGELRREYTKAENPRHRASLKQLIISEYETIDPGKLPDDLNEWIKTEIKPYK